MHIVHWTGMKVIMQYMLLLVETLKEWQA